MSVYRTIGPLVLWSLLELGEGLFLVTELHGCHDENCSKSSSEPEPLTLQLEM